MRPSDLLDPSIRQVCWLHMLALLTGLAAAVWSDGFDDLTRRVSTIETPEPTSRELDAALAETVAEESIAARKRLVIEAGSGAPFNPKARNPKEIFPIVLCRLALDPSDGDASAYVPRGMLFRGQGDTFGKCSLSRIFCGFRESLPPDSLEALKEEVTTYPGFLSGGTENHVTMRRVAGLLFGGAFPRDTFHFGLTGEQLAAECKEYMRKYGQAIYDASMVEYLSPIYHSVHTAAWLNAVEFAQSAEAKIMARAILDWMIVDYALDYHHGIILPPLQRAKGSLTNTYQLSHARGRSQWTGWLYWGGGNTPQDETPFRQPQYVPQPPYGSDAMLHAVSSWAPHPVIRNIGAKRLKTPYMVWQSRGNWACIEPAQVNEYGKTRFAHDQEPNPRNHMRSVYVARDYAVCASYRHEDIMDPIARHAVPFMVVWRSKDPRNWMIVNHPYWYTQRKREGSDEPLGVEDWSGVSPFCQMVHWENAVVLLFDIPKVDPYEGKAGKGSPLFLSERTRENLQRIHFYLPETVDEVVEAGGAVFVRGGETYISIQPLVSKVHWEDGIHEGFRRLVLEGGLSGAAIEVGDETEFDSFDAFRKRIAATGLDLSRLQTQKRVAYRSTRGYTLDIRHSDEGWLPDGRINGTRLEFDRWPTCESPYVTCRDRVLDINDGREGFTIDWRGDLPEYTYYRLEGGQKSVTRRERVVDGVLRIE